MNSALSEPTRASKCLTLIILCPHFLPSFPPPLPFEQKVPEGAPCKIQITGNAQTTELAVKLCNDIMAGGPTSGLRPSGGVGGGMMGAPIMGGYGGGMIGGGAYGGGGMVMGAAAYGGGYPGGGGGYPGAYGAPQQHHQAAPHGGYGGAYHQQPAAYGGGAGYPQAHAAPQQAAYGAYPQPAQAQAARPKAWSEHDDGAGNKYWYNAATGLSQWERPADA